MSEPLSPPPVIGAGGNDLPAYVSNGMIGLRVLPNPLLSGVMMVSGYTGEHLRHKLEAAASAPYPLAVNLALDDIWMADVPSRIEVIEQSYDFATAELTSRLQFAVDGARAEITVVTFCSREQPTIICQEVSIRPEGARQIKLRAMIDGRGVEGRPVMLKRAEAELCDGALRWQSAGGLSTCGIAYLTQLEGADVEPHCPPAVEKQVVQSEYTFPARARTYRLRQIVSVVPSALHQQPDDQAVRLLGKAARDGFERLREANRAQWRQLWDLRIRLVGADERWQLLTDAAFFYLNTSVHPSSPASTSIFGLSAWRDYHYYYGHVMWDIEAFAVPPLTFFQPEAAANLLGYRFRHLDAARRNAKLKGRRGTQFPWESAPSTGEEAAPMPGSASWYADHVSLDVALGFAHYANVTGEPRFLSDYCWPVLSGVADWLSSRAIETERGFEIREAMGIAERQMPADNNAYTNMAARMVLRQAIDAAQRLDRPFEPRWQEIEERLVLPRRGKAVISHDGFRVSEEKGATPDPLMGIFPVGYRLEPDEEKATLQFYLGQTDAYIGAPMLSALYGTWAAWTGDRSLSARLLEEGYGKFSTGRFCQTLEYRTDVFPEQMPASPFLANIGGFLTGLLLGFPGIRPSSADPEHWPQRQVILPEGWDAIEIDRIEVRGKPMRLVARHGADRALIGE